MLGGASISDLPVIRRIVAEAFQSDPMMEWIFPDRATRLDSVAAWLGLFVEGYLLGGRVDVLRLEAIRAVAMWRMPGDDRAFPRVPSITGLLTALIGRGRAEQIGMGLRSIGTLTPTRPFAYLHFLAVDINHQREGLGRMVVEPGLRLPAIRGSVPTWRRPTHPTSPSTGRSASRSAAITGSGPVVRKCGHSGEMPPSPGCPSARCSRTETGTQS